LTALPQLALSVRQPWAWAIIHAGKNIENRSFGAVRHMLPLLGRRAIHASKGMTREEYVSAAAFMDEHGVKCPPAIDLLRGGIIGSVEVVRAVKESLSPWFFGPCGLVLADAQPCDFIPAVGALGYFHWKPADASIVPALARWMLPAGQAAAPADKLSTGDLFG
jgi:hypothetical protein